MWASEGWSEKTSQSRGSHLQHLWSSTDSLCVDGIYTESLYIKQHIKEVYRLGRKRQSTEKWENTWKKGYQDGHYKPSYESGENKTRIRHHFLFASLADMTKSDNLVSELGFWWMCGTVRAPFTVRRANWTKHSGTQVGITVKLKKYQADLNTIKNTNTLQPNKSTAHTTCIPEKLLHRCTRKWQPTVISQGQRSLAGYSPWGHKELDVSQGLINNK